MLPIDDQELFIRHRKCLTFLSLRRVREFSGCAGEESTVPERRLAEDRQFQKFRMAFTFDLKASAETPFRSSLIFEITAPRHPAQRVGLIASLSFEKR